MYSALMILQATENCSVKVVEKRSSFDRPQVVLLPFKTAKTLPEKIKAQLWPDENIRRTFFGPHSTSDKGFWPYSNAKYAQFVKIANFQMIIKKYIDQNFSANQFCFETSDDLDVADLEECIGQYDLVLIAAGNGLFTQNLRQLMNISQSTSDYDERDEIDRRAIYLNYEAAEGETYERNGKLIERSDMGAEGVTYAHSNDFMNHVQIYTYPVGPLREIFASMPESFKAKAAYSSCSFPLTLDGQKNSVLSKEETVWFEDYSHAVERIFHKFDISVPSKNQIKVYFAPRFEYHYNKAAASLHDVPVLFIGDSCGFTDYKLGLSLGRGLLVTKHLASKMKSSRNVAFSKIIGFFNECWEQIVAKEFNQKNMLLTRTPGIAFTYYMDGQVVDGKYLQRESFMEEYRQILNP